MIRREFKGISLRAKHLLNIEENFDVDFKISLQGLTSEDLVAFANSSNGGAILIGVKEVNDINGMQKGEVTGCNIGDKHKNSILNKANDCLPPIEIEIYTENTTRNPFYRIEIKSSTNKPHCTKSGTYKIRDHSINKGIAPELLLTMFIEKEYNKFIKDFARSSNELKHDVMTLRKNLLQNIDDIESTIHNLGNNIEQMLDNIHGSTESILEFINENLGWTDETRGELLDTNRKIETIEATTEYCEKALGAILKKLDIENPMKTEQKMHAINYAKLIVSVAKRKNVNPIEFMDIYMEVFNTYSLLSKEEREEIYRSLI